MAKRRKSMSRKKRADFFVEHGGVCCYCGGKIQQGEAWEAAHIGKDRALRLLRDRFTGAEIPADPDIDPDDPQFMRPAHIKCHAGHTHGEDGNRAIAKANRLYDKHHGFNRKPSTFPKRADPWGKKRRFGSNS
jgi:hypothetical protein